MSVTIELKKGENAWKAGIKDEDQTNLDDEELLKKKVRSIMNKLTLPKFETLMNHFKELTIDSEVKLSSCVDLVFEKAIGDPVSTSPCAQMCKVIQMKKVPIEGQEKQCVNFRKLLICRCQREFDILDILDMADLDQDQYIKDMNDAKTEEDKKRVKEEFEFNEKRLRQRSLGIIRFVGELYKLQMLTARIMHECVKRLLIKDDDQSLECLCCLLTTVGKELDQETRSRLQKGSAKQNAGINDLDKYFKEMEVSMKDKKTSARVRFLIQDVVDLRLNKWKRRKYSDIKYVKEHVNKSLLLLGEEDMFKKVNLTEKRDFNPDDPLENKFRLAKGHYLNVSGKFASPIESIDYVENRALFENFERKKSEFRAEGKDTKEYFLFHGTNNGNVDSILKENFCIDFAGKHGNVHGRGIYFSEKTTIPNLYMSGSKKTLLLCRVLLGREFLGLEKDIPKGFDSKSVLPDEEKRANINIIKEVDQILPCFVLNLAPSNGPDQFLTKLMKSGHVKTIKIKK